MSTPFTPEQYSVLVQTLEAMRSIYASGYSRQPQQLLRDLHEDGTISAWVFIYLIEWFGKVGQDSAYIPYMVAELCEERT